MDYDLIEDGEHRDLHIYNIGEWSEAKLVEAFHNALANVKFDRAQRIELAIENQVSACLDLLSVSDLEADADLTISVEEKLEAVREFRAAKGLWNETWTIETAHLYQRWGQAINWTSWYDYEWSLCMVQTHWIHFHQVWVRLMNSQQEAKLRREILELYRELGEMAIASHAYGDDYNTEMRAVDAMITHKLKQIPKETN